MKSWNLCEVFDTVTEILEWVAPLVQGVPERMPVSPVSHS
jgi:hypothetical protein